jgi:uncharacterized membrane protein
MTTTVEQSIDVDVPVTTAYNQWTQFEEFPEFMEGVEQITQVTPTRTHWTVRIAGVRREFDAEITEQHPDERVAWRSIDGPTQTGVVTFHRLAPECTRVMLQMQFEPEGLAEQAGDKLGLVRTRAKRDLERFKSFIENRGVETGGWRGDVPAGQRHGDSALGDYRGDPPLGGDQPLGSAPPSDYRTDRPAGAGDYRSDVPQGDYRTDRPQRDFRTDQPEGDYRRDVPPS